MACKSGHSAVVGFQHSAQSFAALDNAGAADRNGIREDQSVAEALMVALSVVQLSNTTPILGISVKSAILGIHGMGGQYGCMPLS
jgi:hypothetical protein